MTWCIDPFRYLGVRIYRTRKDLFERNVVGATTAIQSQMNFWKTLSLAISGRVALVKMVVLPRLLYYFTILSIIISPPFFRKWEGIIRDCVWGMSRHRVSLGKLYLSTDQGRIAVPNFEHYYLASQLQWIARWLSSQYLADMASLQPPIPHQTLLQIFHPCTKPRPIGALLPTITFKCFRRSHFLTRALIPYASAIPLLGTP